MSETQAIYETKPNQDHLVIRAIREVIWQTGCGDVRIEIRGGEIVEIVKTIKEILK